MHEVDGPIPANQARPLIKKIAAEGYIAFSEHSFLRQAQRNLTETDVRNVLRAARADAIDGPYFENGSWRFKIWTQKITVIVSIRSETKLTVVTAWRNP